MLQLESVFKSYGTTKALEDISFAVKSGECVCVVGRSGCGKSTLLKLIAIIAKPTKGKIIIDGKATDALTNEELDRFRRESIAYSFQEPLLIPYMTALENLTAVIGAKRENAVEVLSQLGLSDRLNHKSSKLSGGERKRVDIARALLKGSRLLVADEPLSNLDPATSLKVISLLKAHAKKGGAVVYSSVEPSDAVFADRVIQM